MVWLADFNLHIGRERGRQTQPRTENFQDQRITELDQFHPAAQAHAERFKPLHLLVVGRDLADDGTDTRLKLIQPDKFRCSLS